LLFFPEISFFVLSEKPFQSNEHGQESCNAADGEGQLPNYIKEYKGITTKSLPFFKFRMITPGEGGYKRSSALSHFIIRSWRVDFYF